MSWRLDKTHAAYSLLTPPVQRKFDEWQNDIHRNGTHPKTAAETVGAFQYESLANEKYSIRLSQSDRVLFKLENSCVRLLEVGGHN
ncbi:MAG: hypothetical protein OCC49_00595 [Fibrobacterales bacterium]